MTRPKDDVSIRQMPDHARETVGMVRDMSRSGLEEDRKSSLALVQLLQIVGEAARRVSPETQQKPVEGPWGQIVSLRNRLIDS